jgi:hypothetical protein
MLLSACFAAAVGLTGCCGRGPSNTCTSAAEIKGAKYSSRGTGSTRADAEKEAAAGVCLDYCQRGDPEVGQAWKTWKATPDGQRTKTDKSFDVDFQPSLKPIYKRCEATCSANVATKTIAIVTTCEK